MLNRKSLKRLMLVSTFVLSSCQAQGAAPTVAVDTPVTASTPTSIPTTTPGPTATTAPTPLPNPDLGPLQIVGQIGGPTQAVAAAGHYAYVGVGSRLTVLDVSAPDSPRELGSSEPFGAAVRDVGVFGDTAYVAAGDAGLYSLDISDPARPAIIGNYDSSGYAEGVAVTDNYAYLADGPGGLRMIDIADRARPVEVSAVYELNYTFDVAVDGNYAYIASAGAGLLVVDVSEPEHPSAVSSYGLPGYAYGISVSGSTVYVADGWGGLQTLDVSNPAQPESLGSYATPGWAMDVAAVGNMLYLADASGGLRVWNVSDPLKLTELGSFQVPDGHTAHLAVNGSTVYLADIRRGVHIVDVSAPGAPRRMGVYSPLGYAQAVVVADGYAYVAAQNYGLRVIDLADPRRPREAAALTMPDAAVSLALSAPTAYVATTVGQTSKLPPQLIPVDISDPLHPQAAPAQLLEGHQGIATFEGGPSASGNTITMVSRNMFTQGEILYNAGEWGLLLLDISDPLAPKELSFIQTVDDPSGNKATATGVAVDGNVAYLAVSEAGLYLIDVSDARQPALLGVFNDPPGGKRPSGDKVSDVVVAAPYAYILYDDFVQVVDVSDPRHPKGLGSFPIPLEPFVGSAGGAARSLAIDGSKLFIADSAAGLLELDVTDPARPQLVGELRLPGLALWVFVDKGFVYVADGESGLFIIQIVETASASITPEFSSRPNALETAQYRAPSVGAFAWVRTDTRLSSPETSRPPLPVFQLVAQRYGAAQYVVTSAADSGPGTLREALRRAASGDTITFDPLVFPPGAPVAIRLTSALPGLGRGGVTLDASNAGVILDGSGTSAGTNGLSIGSNNNTVMGLQILNFPGTGISLGGRDNTVGGDRLQGAGPLGQGNLISGNQDVGINVCCGEDNSGNRIIGNYIGTDVTGAKILGNGYAGMVIGGWRNIVGGRTAGERNVISGNGTFEIETKMASGNLIVGNYIGLDANGRSQLGQPDFWSIAIWGASSSNRIERNVIAGTLGINDPGSSYNEVIGNYFGTDATGTIPLADEANVVVNLPFNRIGGSQPGEGNVIRGRITIRGAWDVMVMGNLIGIDSSGQKPFPSSGRLVDLGAGAHHNFIGGATSAERNVIAGRKDSTLIHLGGIADYNFIAGNFLGTDTGGSAVFPNLAGISLEAAEHNAIQGNLVTGSQAIGISLAGFDWDQSGADFNWLRANRITQNKVGLAVGGGEGNIVMGNSFIENDVNGQDGGRNNQWDDGSQGNYWSDYTGKDANNDGIGDAPYTIPANGADNFPLLNSIPPKFPG